MALTGGPSSSAETSAIPGGGQDPLRSQGDVRRAEGNRVEAQPMATPSGATAIAWNA